MEHPQRETMEFDVVIIGAGPAGLATAIKLKQISPNLSIVVVEKGAEVGAHILSGAVIDPVGLDRLMPEWRTDTSCPVKTKVSEDRFLYLGPAGSMRLPNFLMPKLMSNHGNYVISLGDLTRWLGIKAEELGVEIYPGFAACDVVYDQAGTVIGIATGDMGISREGTPKESFTRGMELHGKYVVFAEGAHGQITKQVTQKFGLRQNCDPQKYGLGLKEVWEIKPEYHKAGFVQHSFGWPLTNDTGGGSFLYHYGHNLVSVGFVVHLNYQNPTLSPFDEFQRFKTHPAISDMFAGAKRISYGARVITEGGYQSVPKLVFPGGCLVGCAAGFVNLPRIKGSHNALLSGILAATHLAEALSQGRSQDELTHYEQAWRGSDIGQDLWKVRNVKPLWSRFGTALGVAFGALDMWMNSLIGLSFFGTLKHGKADYESLKPLDQVKPIMYPKPDGVLTFDRLSSVFISNTNHEEDQPAHLKLIDPSIPVNVNLPLYGEPARLYCPAGVYEIVYGDEALKLDPRFVINAQNCVRCKTCDIKDPSQNIVWVAPEGGGGPNYMGM